MSSSSQTSVLPDTIYLHCAIDFIDESITRVQQRHEPRFCHCVAYKMADCQDYELDIDIDTENPTDRQLFSMKEYGIIVCIMFYRRCAARNDRIIKVPFASTYGLPPSYFADFRENVHAHGTVHGCRKLNPIGLTLNFAKIKGEAVLASGKAHISASIMNDWAQYMREAFNQEMNGL